MGRTPCASLRYAPHRPFCAAPLYVSPSLSPPKVPPIDSREDPGHTSPMSYHAKDVMQDLARYNERANGEMYEILSALTDRARKREAGSWFGSIHSLLNHVIICDINWLQRFRTLSPDSPVLNDPGLNPPGLSWAHDLHDDFERLREERVFVDTKIRAWFAEFPEERYGEKFQYVDSKGASQRPVAAAAFEFLFLHQIHHRGEVAQVLDCLGLPNNFADNKAFLHAAE
jgi:uncharacterized damage-inducible protein DinB